MLEERLDLLGLGLLHRLEDLVGLLLVQLAEDVGGPAGVHLLEDVGGALGGDVLDQRGRDLGARLLERAGRGLDVHAIDERRALLRAELLDDVGEVGRVHRREHPLRDVEADLAGADLQRLHELPRDEALLVEILRARPERSHREIGELLPAHAAHETAEAGVDVRETQPPGGEQEVEIVDADDLRAVDVDDLPVEDLLDEADAIGRGLRRERRRLGRGLAQSDERIPALGGDPPALVRPGRAHDERIDRRIHLARRDDQIGDAAEIAIGATDATTQQLRQVEEPRGRAQRRDRGVLARHESKLPQRPRARR